MGVPGRWRWYGMTVCCLLFIGFYLHYSGILPIQHLEASAFLDAKVTLSNGAVFEVEAQNASADNKYIDQSIHWMGKEWNKSCSATMIWKNGMRQQLISSIVVSPTKHGVVEQEMSSPSIEKMKWLYLPWRKSVEELHDLGVMDLQQIQLKPMRRFYTMIYSLLGNTNTDCHPIRFYEQCLPFLDIARLQQYILKKKRKDVYSSTFSLSGDGWSGILGWWISIARNGNRISFSWWIYEEIGLISCPVSVNPRHVHDGTAAPNATEIYAGMVEEYLTTSDYPVPHKMRGASWWFVFPALRSFRRSIEGSFWLETFHLNLVRLYAVYLMESWSHDIIGESPSDDGYGLKMRCNRQKT